MELSDTRMIDAPRAKVWAALNDAKILKQCIPGCQSLDQESEDAMTAKVTLKIGPIKATFTGAVTLSDRDPPRAWTISGQGTGGIAGSAKGSARVTLEEEDGATRLSYHATAHVSGKIAQLGARLIDSTAKKLAAEFFERFSVLVGEQTPVLDGNIPQLTGDGFSGDVLEPTPMHASPWLAVIPGAVRE